MQGLGQVGAMVWIIQTMKTETALFSTQPVVQFRHLSYFLRAALAETASLTRRLPSVTVEETNVRD
jgi:hypothetical protein